MSGHPFPSPAPSWGDNLSRSLVKINQILWNQYGGPNVAAPSFADDATASARKINTILYNQFGGGPSGPTGVTYTWWVPPDPTAGAAVAGNYGLSFSVSVAGQITSASFYKGQGEVSILSHTMWLYDMTGGTWTQLWTQSTSNEPNAAGWIGFTLSPAVNLVPDKTYWLGWNTQNTIVRNTGVLPATRGPITGHDTVFGSGFPPYSNTSASDPGVNFEFLT